MHIVVLQTIFQLPTCLRFLHLSVAKENVCSSTYFAIRLRFQIKINFVLFLCCLQLQIIFLFKNQTFSFQIFPSYSYRYNLRIQHVIKGKGIWKGNLISKTAQQAKYMSNNEAIRLRENQGSGLKKLVFNLQIYNFVHVL